MELASCSGAGGHCPSNRWGITADQVRSETLRRIWSERRSVVVTEAEGYVRSRRAFAYRTLVRQRSIQLQREHPVDPGLLGEVTGEVGREDPTERVADRLAEAVWIRDAQRIVTGRVAALERGDLARARALATLLTMLAIAANDGRHPVGPPARSGRLDEGEGELLAATWMADPRLRSTAGTPDDAAIRKRRQRLVEKVRAELRELRDELSDELRDELSDSPGDRGAS